jgi:hypothetical protein
MAGLGGRIMESGHFAEALPMAHLEPEAVCPLPVRVIWKADI